MHGLEEEEEEREVKKEPCWHFLILATAAITFLLEGFCPLPEKAGFPSARSISLSSWYLRPWKWCDFLVAILVAAAVVASMSAVASRVQ